MTLLCDRRRSRLCPPMTTCAGGWRTRGGGGPPPQWLADAVAVQLSGFTTQSLAGDLGRSPDQVARVSAQVIEAALTSALAQPA